MGKYGTFLIIAALASQIQSVLSAPKCKNPKGQVGTIISHGCYQQTCEKSGGKGVWKESICNLTCCAYQRKGYKIGATITKIIADDGCTKVNLVCAQKGGGADIELKVDNDCAQPASERSMLAQFVMVKDSLAEILNNTEECCNECPPNTTAELLFLGPSSLTQGLSKVLNLTALTPSTCIPPPHPQTGVLGVLGYVGTVWNEGTLLCGGANSSNTLNTCYRLKMFTSTTGSWISFPPMHQSRLGSAAAMLGNDWWVTGGVNFDEGSTASTELLSPSDKWSPWVDLPEKIVGHCLLNIDSTHLFMCGGYTSSGTPGATYIYTQGDGFVVQPSMAVARNSQGCALFDGAIWVAGGAGSDVSRTSVEFFSLTSLSWTTGPRLPVATVGGDLVVIDGKLVLIGGANIYQLQGTAWVDVGTLNQTRNFSALKWKTCIIN